MPYIVWTRVIFWKNLVCGVLSVTGHRSVCNAHALHWEWHRACKETGGLAYISMFFLTSAAYGREWSASRPGPFTPAVNYVTPIAGVDVQRKSNDGSSIVESWASHYIDWAIPAPAKDCSVKEAARISVMLNYFCLSTLKFINDWFTKYAASFQQLVMSCVLTCHRQSGAVTSPCPVSTQSCLLVENLFGVDSDRKIT